MLKTPNKLILKLESDWSVKENNDNYAFLDDMDDMVSAIFYSVSKMNTDLTNSFSVVKHNTIVCIHSLLSETLLSILSELRIVLNTLNRSIIENYIILKFIIKHGVVAAKIFNANSEFAYHRTLLEHKRGLTEQEIHEHNEAIARLKNKFPNTQFSKGYKWGNQFLGKPKKYNLGLKDIASSIGIESDYKMLSNFHHQTHSSSAFAQHMNSAEFNDYDMYIMKAVMPFNYAYKVCKLVFSKSEIFDIESSYESIMKKYKMSYQNQ